MNNFEGRLQTIYGLIKAVGFAKAIEILVRRAAGLNGIVYAKVNGRVLEVRPNDSDLFVLTQVFGWQEYSIDCDRLSQLRRTAEDWLAMNIKPIIIDAGANVGYSTLYFSEMFPRALVLAIEPDQKSFRILTRHAGANPAIKPIHAALWSHDRGIKLRSSNNRSCASHVVEGAGTPSKRIDDLLASIPNSRPLVIKLDIEGAEREVVGSATEVFRNAPCIVVEPHDFMHHGAACLSPLYRVVGAGQFDTILCGENIFFFAVTNDHALSRPSPQ